MLMTLLFLFKKKSAGLLRAMRTCRCVPGSSAAQELVNTFVRKHTPLNPPSRGDSSNSPGKTSRNSPGKTSRNSPEKNSRNSPGRNSRNSPEKNSRNSPEKNSRNSPLEGGQGGVSAIQVLAQLSLLFLCFLPQTLLAQNFERVTEGISFVRNNQILELPFTGGLDSFLPQFVDIDADGDFDLFIAQSEERGAQLAMFENIGAPQAHRFRLNRTPFDTMTVNTWYHFVDIDADRDFDLFHADGRNGLSFRRNIGAPAQAQFRFEADSVVDVAGRKVVSEYTSVPTFADIDGDADYDFFYGNTLGFIVLYRNLGTPRAPSFFFETEEWEGLKIISGGLSANAMTTTPPLIPPQGGTFSIPPEEPLTIPPLRGARGVLSASTNFQHGANGIAFTDLDHDGDQDFFYGDLFHKSIYHFRNDGNVQEPVVALADSLFPQPQPVSTPGHNIPRFADIDADGDDDFFVAGLRQYQSNFLFYRNVGEATRPQLKSTTQSFLPIFDAGSYCSPTFGDLDGDGDLDLMLGNIDGQFVYCENIGAPNAPAFHWVSDNFQNLRINLYATSAPALVDIDGDGDRDLFSGDFYGRIAFFENRGTPRAPNFVLNTSSYQSIDVGNSSAPDFADGDLDGDFDLYVGEGNAGVVNIFENTGTPLQPAFSSKPRKEFSHVVPADDAAPCLFDWNRDGFLDLFVGTRAGKILHYRGTAALDSFVFVSAAFENIDVAFNSVPRFVNWDNDNKVDLIVGEQAGGVNYFRAVGNSAVSERGAAPSFFMLHAYPNPFARHVTLVVNAPERNLAATPRLHVYNLLGATVAELELENTSAGVWQTQWRPRDLHLTRGLYFLQVKWGSAQLTRKAFYQP